MTAPFVARTAAGPFAASLRPGRRLLRLRMAALLRRARAQALPMLVLMPLIGGTSLVLLARVSADLRTFPWPQATEPLAWGGAVLMALAAVRHRVGPQVRSDLVALQPLGPLARFVGGYFTAAGRVAPILPAVGVVVFVAGGTPARWGGLALLAVGVPLLARMVPSEAPDTRRPRRGRRGRIAGLLARLAPERVRPHLRRDLTLLLRGGARGSGMALAGCALGVLAVAACTGATGGTPRPRAGMLAGALSAWAAAATVFPMTRDRWLRSWLEADAGVPARDFWSARVAFGLLLGAGVGSVAGLVWLPASVAAAWHFPLVGAASGAITGATVMEGDGRPLLASLVALFPVVLVTALGTLHIGGLLAVFPVVGYLGGLAAPRVERRFRLVAPES